VNRSIQVLWFVQEREGSDDAELLIGVYETEDDAKAAIERLRGKPGFVDFPQGFTAVPYELNEDHWTKGFVRKK
jgi:homoserine kinase type II